MAITGILGTNVLGIGAAAIVGAVLGGAIGLLIGDTANTVAEAIGGVVGALSAAAVVVEALRRGATRFEVGAYVGALGVVICLFALIPIVGYVLAVLLPVLAARMRGRQAAIRRSSRRWPVDPPVDRRRRACGDGRRQLRRRGIVDERVLSAIGRVPREAVRAGKPPLARLRRRRASDRARADDLAAVRHGDDLRTPRARGHERVLDVGTGSGYQAAVLAEGLAAEVVTIERVPELAEQAGVRLGDAGYATVEVRVGVRLARRPGTSAVRRHRRGCRRSSVPRALYEQLSDGGRLVLPRSSRRGQDLVLVLRTPEGPAERASISCRFVPLVGDSEGFGDD